MATISARKGKTLYVLASERHYWIATLATNRHDCYTYAKRYCRTENNYKKELELGGYKCIAVQIKER